MENKVSKLFDEMQDLLNDSQNDVTKFCEGNNSAGTRVRKTMQAIKALAQEVRTEVQEQKNATFA
jgi:predicted transcriptional regulator